ncbi:ribonuclease H-like domain-containing protein [Tanacetum coccineum]
MMTYLKHVGGKKHSDLKTKSFDEIQEMKEQALMLLEESKERYSVKGEIKAEKGYKESKSGPINHTQKILKFEFFGENFEDYDGNPQQKKMIKVFLEQLTRMGDCPDGDCMKLVEFAYWSLRMGQSYYMQAERNKMDSLKMSKLSKIKIKIVLTSFVLNGKSPFELVYGFKPKLSHLRSFGCLCFSSVFNNSDKFSAKSEKCHSDFQSSLSPNDDGRVYDTLHNDGNDHSCSINADECEDDFATSMGETSISEGNVHINSESLDQGNLPQNISQAFKNPNWIEAINNEIEALHRNFTWTVCDLPVGRKAVYVDVAICNGWDLFQLDINNAFLYGDLSKDVYMTLPLGFDTNKSKVFKLNKFLYGLKQAPRQWNAKLTQALIEHGFVQSKFDYSLFTKNSDNVFIILLVYVDDIVVIGNNLNEIEKQQRWYCLSQRKYCLELLHEFGLLAAKHVDTPLPENATLNHTESDDDHLLMNVSNYQRLIGKHIYLTNTRPDITYVVHYLSQYMDSPLNSHLDAALRVLRYIKGSPGSGIQINKTGNLKLRAYADSDYARCPATRKFVSGYCVFLGDSLVTWKSKKQSTLSRSSAEAEYRSMASATCKVISLSNLLGDMGVKNLLPVVMYYGNSSAL